MSRSTLEQKLLFDNISYDWISSEKLINYLIPKINVVRARKAFTKYYEPDNNRTLSEEYKTYWGAKTLLIRAIETAHATSAVQIRKDSNSPHFWIRSNKFTADDIDAIISETVVTAQYDGPSFKDNVIVNRDNVVDKVMLSFLTHDQNNQIKAFNAVMSPFAAVMLADQLQSNSLVYVSDENVDL